MLAYLGLLTSQHREPVTFSWAVSVPRRSVGVHCVCELLGQVDEKGRAFWNLMDFPAETAIRVPQPLDSGTWRQSWTSPLGNRWPPPDKVFDLVRGKDRIPEVPLRWQPRGG